MKTLKFRVWNKDYSEFSINTITELIGGMYYEDAVNSNFEQFTGLKDKNGVDIYEGDIVNCIPLDEYIKDDCMYGIREVVWDDSDASFYYDSFIVMNWGGIKSYEVVGNIHQNKDLLR